MATTKASTPSPYNAFNSETAQPIMHTNDKTVPPPVATDAYQRVAHNAMPPGAHQGTTSRRMNPFWLTLVLVTYGILNFALSVTAFTLVLPVVITAAVLIPFFGLGYFIYKYSIPLFRGLAVFDVMLANMTTHDADKVYMDEVNGNVHSNYSKALCMAPQLEQVSGRSCMLLVYFVTIKFAIGILNLVVVTLPVLPIVSHIVADHTDESTNAYVAGYNVHEFNFHTDPTLYSLACVGYMVGGIIAIHVVARLSRSLTRFVCCDAINSPHSVA